MEPGREQPPAELERLRAEAEKLMFAAEAAKSMADGRRFDNHATSSTSCCSPYSLRWSPPIGDIPDRAFYLDQALPWVRVRSK